MIDFSRVEPLAGTRWLHADAETNERTTAARRVGAAVVSPSAPSTRRWSSGRSSWRWRRRARWCPSPDRRLRRLPVRPGGGQGHRRADPREAGRDAAQGADERRPADRGPEEEAGQQRELLAHRPARRGAAQAIAKGEHKGKWQVEVHGFDYYNTKTGEIESGDADKIAMWMLDTDYDGRSLFPRQVFFPMAGEKDGWARLAKNLKAEIDEDADRGLSRHGLAALRSGRAPAGGGEDRRRPRHREPRRSIVDLETDGCRGIDHLIINSPYEEPAQLLELRPRDADASSLERRAAGRRATSSPRTARRSFDDPASSSSSRWSTRSGRG